MAVVAVVMAGDEGKPAFHDFFGADPPPLPPFVKGIAGHAGSFSAGAASSVAYRPVSGSSDLGSERQAVNSFGFQLHGSKSDFPVTEISSRLSSGRKLSNSDSSFMGFAGERVLQMGPDALDNQRLMKMFQSEDRSERAKRKHVDESFIGMQGPRPTSTTHILQRPANSRPDMAMSNWDCSLPIRVGHVAHHPSRFGQFATYEDKQSSIRHKDTSGVNIISQPAADESSRTGIKGSNILNLVRSNSGNFERHLSAALPVVNRPRLGSSSIETEFNELPSRHGLRSASQQMTIFYSGQAHVFDDVHPSKAEAIMALAGSSGGSWSTTYALKTSTRPSITEAYTPTADNNRTINTNRAASAHQIQQKPCAAATLTPRFSEGANQGSPGGGDRNGVQESQPDIQSKQVGR